MTDSLSIWAYAWRGLLTAIVILVGTWYFWNSLVNRNSDWVFGVDRETRIHVPFADTSADNNQTNISAYSNSLFSQSSQTIRGQVSEVLDSIELDWASPSYDPFSLVIPSVEDFSPMDKAHIEKEHSNEGGYVGYTLVGIVDAQIGKKTDSTGGAISIYNQTILATQQTDSTVALSVVRTPGPIPWEVFALHGQYARSPDPNAGSPNSESRRIRTVFEYGSPTGTGFVQGKYFPWPQDSTRRNFLSTLELNGWQSMPTDDSATIVLVRRQGLLENLIVSFVGEDSDSATLVITSYKGGPGTAP